MKRVIAGSILLALLLISGCATTPTSPQPGQESPSPVKEIYEDSPIIGTWLIPAVPEIEGMKNYEMTFYPDGRLLDEWYYPENPTARGNREGEYVLFEREGETFIDSRLISQNNPAQWDISTDEDGKEILHITFTEKTGAYIPSDTDYYNYYYERISTGKEE